ncbi:MAG: RNA polymerase sigma factor [Planctomycetota bacterium]
MAEIPPDLIQRAVERDQKACREIVETLHRPVLATIYRFLGRRSVEEVEDIGQEIFLKIFRSLERFDPGRGVKFSTWVYTFVRNHCFDVLKKRRISTVSLHSPETEQKDWELEDRNLRKPAERTLDRELGSQIESALQSLTEEHRMVFVLREYQQMDLKSIARVMDCSEGTVKSRLHRAKAAMRRKLAKYLNSEWDKDRKDGQREARA